MRVGLIVTMSLLSFAACTTRVDEDRAAAFAPAAEDALVTGLAWVGDTRVGHHGRVLALDLVMSGRDLDVETQTWPAGSAVSVTLEWLREGVLHGAAMTRAPTGTSVGNDVWRASLPGDELEDGVPLAFWIRAEGADGATLWDSRGGDNYVVTPRAALRLDDKDCWHMAGRGDVVATNGVLRAEPDDGLGLLWCHVPTPADFEVAVEWRMTRADDNGGIVLRFRDPETFGFDNPAWVGVRDGHEVQIDELGRPDAAPWHTTGAIYDEHAQVFTRQVPAPAGSWNRFVIRVQDQHYTVDLNGAQVSSLDWENHDAAWPERALPGAVGAPRFVGVQAHSGHVEYRNVVLRGL